MRTIKAYYYATISFIDYQIGRILDTLEETGQLENTVILFSSDHGEYLGDYNCFGKRGMQDQSSNIPLIIRYPQILKQDNICKTPVSLVDILPTFVDIAGAKIDNNEFDGQSLIAIQNDETDRKYVYSQYDQKESAIYMITSEKWKYIYSAGDDKELLFDKINDTTELFNLANTRTDVKEKIKQDFLNHFKDINYTDAFVENSEKLDWKKYPPKDMSYLNNPDNNLLKQDYEPIGTTLPPQYS
jgi:arylsulfatase A-like enzyme